MAEASHEHAVARCVQGPDGADVGKKSYNATGGRSRHLEEYEGRRNVLAITFRNKDGSVRTVPLTLRHTCSHNLSLFFSAPMTYPFNFPGVFRALFCVREFRFEGRFFQVCSSWSYWSEAACRFVAARVIVAVGRKARNTSCLFQ